MIFKNKCESKFFIFVSMLAIIIVGAFIGTSIYKPKSIVHFINIIPYSIFISALIWIGISVHKDAVLRDIKPYFYAWESMVLFLAFIGLIHYMFKRKLNFKSYKKRFKVDFIINVILGVVVSTGMVLFFNNTVNFLPSSINDNINSTILFFSPVVTIITVILGVKFSDYKNEIKDEFIKNIYKAMLCVNLVPMITTILMFGLFGY